MAAPSHAGPPPGPGEIPIRLDGLAGKLFLTAFFVVHYGIFCAVHGLFTVLLAGGSSADPVGLISDTVQERTFQIAIAAIVLVLGPGGEILAQQPTIVGGQP